MVEIHKEPKEFDGWMKEHCFKCGMPTQYWATPHVPCCPYCALAVSLEEVQKHENKVMSSGMKIGEKK
jgi:hypothetical protein